MGALAILIFISASFLVEAFPTTSDRSIEPYKVKSLDRTVNVFSTENDRKLVRAFATELKKLLDEKRLALNLKFINVAGVDKIPSTLLQKNWEDVIKSVAPLVEAFPTTNGRSIDPNKVKSLDQTFNVFLTEDDRELVLALATDLQKLLEEKRLALNFKFINDVGVDEMQSTAFKKNWDEVMKSVAPFENLLSILINKKATTTTTTPPTTTTITTTTTTTNLPTTTNRS